MGQGPSTWVSPCDRYGWGCISRDQVETVAPAPCHYVMTPLIAPPPTDNSSKGVDALNPPPVICPSEL